MPMFEYTCRACGHSFEALVRGEDKPVCAACHSNDLEKQFSLPAVKSETTHGLAMRAAKKRDAKQGRDRTMDQLNYERSHND
jgi:putative FmdB family regulatory protein